MNEEKGSPLPPRKVEFTSRLGRMESIAVLSYLPVHVGFLPLAFAALMQKGIVDDTGANVGIYLVGALFMLGLCFKFLRRDFDALCDRPFQVIAELVGSYGVMLCCNMLFGMLLNFISGEGNPNNQAVTDMALISYGPVAAMAVYLAPIVEEMLFRAGIFGTLRHYNRISAYVIGVLSFSVYHVWSFAIIEPSYWIYVLQYIPVSFLLCRIYESTNSIWSGIFFHMLINGISLKVLTAAQQLL